MFGIIGAMEEEVLQLKDNMDNPQIVRASGMDFYVGKIHDVDIVVVRSGIGKVNAAMCTQILIDRFLADCIINTGIAGGLNNDIEIGDIVISEDALYHDVDVSVFGYEKGQIPRMDTKVFCADKSLVETALRACKRVNKDISVFVGRIASGDSFISDKARKDFIKKEFLADCVEMEGAAIAHVAYLNNKKFLIVRAISDKADMSANIDYQTFEKKAIEHCFQLTIEIIKTLK